MHRRGWNARRMNQRRMRVWHSAGLYAAKPRLPVGRKCEFIFRIHYKRRAGLLTSLVFTAPAKGCVLKTPFPNIIIDATPPSASICAIVSMTRASLSKPLSIENCFETAKQALKSSALALARVSVRQSIPMRYRQRD